MYEPVWACFLILFLMRVLLHQTNLFGDTVGINDLMCHSPVKLMTLWNKLVFLPRSSGGEAAPTEKTSSETSMQGHQGSPSSPSSPPGCRCTDPDKAALLWAAQRDCCASVPGALMLWLRPCTHAGTRGRGRGEQGRGCEHIWHLQNPAHNSHIIMKKCTGHIEKRVLFSPRYHTCNRRYTQPPTHTHSHISNCVPTTSTI